MAEARLPTDTGVRATGVLLGAGGGGGGRGKKKLPTETEDKDPERVVPDTPPEGTGLPSPGAEGGEPGPPLLLLLLLLSLAAVAVVVVVAVAAAGAAAARGLAWAGAWAALGVAPFLKLEILDPVLKLFHPNFGSNPTNYGDQHQDKEKNSEEKD